MTVVCGHAALGGAEQWLLTMLDGTERLQVEAVVLGDGPLVAALEAREIPVTVIQTGRRPQDLVIASWRLARRLRQRRPDVVVANGVKAAFAVAPAARLSPSRSLWVKHDHVLDGLATRVLARSMDGVVATSTVLAVATGRADAVVVEPPRRAADHLSREDARRRLGLPVGPLLLATVGRLVAYKGNDDAIAALARPGGEQWHLAVIGGPDGSEPFEESRLRALAESAGVADRVHMCGPVAQADRVLAAADAVAVLTKPTAPRRGLFPRSPDREGYGMVVSEAMAAGLPVIVAGEGAAADRVAQGAGIVVPVNDPARVAAALDRLRDEGLRTSLGAVGLRIAAEVDDEPTAADRLVAHLAATARRPGAGLAQGPPMTVVTTVLNDGPALAELMDSVLPQLREEDELVIVDGGSTDGTCVIVRDHPLRDDRTRFHVVPGVGISQGRNVGVRAARTEWIAFTDAGCRPDAGWLDALRCAAAEREPAALVTGVYRVLSSPRALAGPLRAALSEAFAAVGYPTVPEARRPSILVRAYTRLLGQYFDPSLPTGRSMAVRREAWASAEGFPEHLQTGEDVLFGRRIVAEGGVAVLSADAEVAWTQRDRVRTTARMYRSYGFGGGLAGSTLLVGRDAARAVAYLAGAWGITRSGIARDATLAGAALYLSVPLSRALSRDRPLSTIAALPLAAAIRDVSKAVGAVEGVLARRRRTKR